MADQHDEREYERDEPCSGTPGQVDNIDQQSCAADECEATSSDASSRDDTPDASETVLDDVAPRQPRRPRKRGQGPRTRKASGRRSADSGILRLPVRENANVPDVRAAQDEEQADDSAMHELEAQGFTSDEAIRLIHVSDRLAISGEAREAEAVLRRLRFTRWLIERGVLDEFSA
jgi:hypothetical protein